MISIREAHMQSLQSEMSMHRENNKFLQKMLQESDRIMMEKDSLLERMWDSLRDATPNTLWV